MTIKVGFIGLGIMGSGMANNLLAKGFELTVWNRTISKTDEVVGKGAFRAESPSHVAAAADIIYWFLSLFSDDSLLIRVFNKLL